MFIPPIKDIPHPLSFTLSVTFPPEIAELMLSLLAIVHLSLMPSWSMVGFPFKDKWFLDELFGNWRWLLVLLKFYLFPPQSSPICKSTGVPCCITNCQNKRILSISALRPLQGDCLHWQESSPSLVKSLPWVWKRGGWGSPGIRPRS